MVPIMISFEMPDAAIVDALLADAELKAKKVERERVTGGSEFLNVIRVLTPPALAAVVKILHDKWASHTKVKIQAHGVKVEGITPDQAEGILRQILEHERAQANRS